MARVVVVGAGPNGLTAAAWLAMRGADVTVLEANEQAGGGCRSADPLLPGMIIDHCAAVHPLAVGSPAFEELELAAHGLEWKYAPVDCVHPLDDGSAATLLQDIEATADGLGVDRQAWLRIFGPPTRNYEALSNDILGPLLRVPTRPLQLSGFGMRALLPATTLARMFRDPGAQALWAGIAAHAYTRIDRPLSTAIGLGLIAAGHRNGWPVAAGGSASITAALLARLQTAGGTVETGVKVRSLNDVPTADAVIFDLSPGAVARILAERLSVRASARLQHFRRGPAAFKVDFAVQDGIPWTAPSARRAGTVHLGGSLKEIRATEREINQGRMPARPFVLVGQQYLADPQRSAGNIHPVWAYAQVPYGYAGDAAQTLIKQIERFAPGFRNRVLTQRVTNPRQFADDNENFAGGDILTGAITIERLMFGSSATMRHAYSAGLPGHFICSAATPPGPGAHGMCGFHAAQATWDYLARGI